MRNSRAAVSHREEGSRGEEPSSERVMGFEPTTTCLGSRYATAASHPQVHSDYSQKPGKVKCGPPASGGATHKRWGRLQVGYT